MNHKLQSLYQQDLIDRYEYDTYVLFELNELGNAYLKNAIDFIFIDDPKHHGTSEAYARNDGRISIWRDIKIIINTVNLKLKEYSDDGRESPGFDNPYDRTTGRISDKFGGG